MAPSRPQITWKPSRPRTSAGARTPTRSIRAGAVSSKGSSWVARPARRAAADWAMRGADRHRPPHLRLSRPRPFPGPPRSAQRAPRTAIRSWNCPSSASPRPTSTAPSTPALSSACRAATLRELLDALRETYCRTIGVEYMHIQDTRIRRWLQERMEPRRNRPDFDRAQKLRILQEPALRRAVRAVPAHPLHRPEALLAGRGRDAHPAAGSHRREGRRRAASARSSWAWPTAAGSTSWPTSSASPTRRSSPSSRTTTCPSRWTATATSSITSAFPATASTPRGSQIHLSLTPNPSHLEAVDPGGRGPDPRQADAVRRQRAQAGASRC